MQSISSISRLPSFARCRPKQSLLPTPMQQTQGTMAVSMPQAAQGLCCHHPCLRFIPHPASHTRWAHQTLVQQRQTVVGEKRQLPARPAPCTPATCDHSQPTAATSKSISPRQQNSRRSSSLLPPHNSSLTSPPSISRALRRHPIHPNLRSGPSEPPTPLHFSLTHASSHHRRLHLHQLLQDRQHRGPFQTSTTGPESLQMLEFLYFTCSYVEISSKPWLQWLPPSIAVPPWTRQWPSGLLHIAALIVPVQNTLDRTSSRMIEKSVLRTKLG